MGITQIWEELNLKRLRETILKADVPELSGTRVPEPLGGKC